MSQVLSGGIKQENKKKIIKKSKKGERAIFWHKNGSKESVREEKRERERKEQSIERNFSLRSMEIGSWVFVGARGKCDMFL